MTEYATIAPDRAALTAAPEVEIYVQDLTPGRHKYSGSFVRAAVSETAGEDVLWRRTPQGRLDAVPLRITVRARRGVAVAQPPYQD